MIVGGRWIAVLVLAHSVCAGALQSATAQERPSLEETQRDANDGAAWAQIKLGFRYARCLGVAQDYAEAVDWYRKAAEQGDVTAQSNLGLMYANGEGVANDDAGAVKWFGKAAEQGAGDQTKYNVGVMYRYSRSSPRDYVQAHKWFELAAADGNWDSAAARDEVEKLMSQAQIAEAQKLAREWKPTQERPQ